MLQQLRRTFTTITCMLLAAVLLLVQSLSVISSYLALQDTVRGSLEYGLQADPATPPILGNHNTDISVYSHLLIAKILLGSDGAIISSNSSQVDVNPQALIYIIESLNAGEKSGVVRDSHLIWQSRTMPDGTYRVAIADTTTVDTSLNKQISFNLVGFAIMMAIIFVASWILSKKALLPVERSWIQQKRFIADASHELKTPLAVILSNTQILMRHVDDLPAQDQIWVRATSEEAQRMKDLVEDLLALTRSELAQEDKTIHIQEDINLTALIERICLQFDAVAFERGCFIETKLAPDVHLKGDPAEIEKLIKILVDNACKYSKQGSVVIVSLSRQGKLLAFNVNNQGDPIDPEELPHVFDRFFRSDKVRTRNQSGSYGLGLAIAQSITHEHRGKISVTSNAFEGTTFTCTFPFSPAEKDL